MLVEKKFENEPRTEIRLLVKKSNVRKLKYLESFSDEIMDLMISGLYETFKKGESKEWKNEKIYIKKRK